MVKCEIFVDITSNNSQYVGVVVTIARQIEHLMRVALELKGEGGTTTMPMKKKAATKKKAAKKK
jgi:hypothetical protein